MLMFKKVFYAAIAAGQKTTTLRYWRRPRVRPGSVHTVPHLGKLAIESVQPILPEDLTDSHAHSDGFASLADLHTALNTLYSPAAVGADKRLFLVRFRFLGTGR